jgi:alcohol dehydrogenase class IV
MFASLGMPPRLRDAGVPSEPLGEVAALAMGDWFLRGNPRPVQHSNELFEILQRAW